MRFISRLLVAFTLVLFASIASAEDVGLRDFDGESKSLDDYLGKGQWTVVQVWSHSCHICNQEAPALQAFGERMEDSDLARVVGVSMDGEEGILDAEHFVEKYGFKHTNLIAEPMGAALMVAKRARMRFVGTPTYLLFDRKGTFRVGQAGGVPMHVIEKYMREHDEG